MTNLPIGHSAYERVYSGAPAIRVENRFLEETPANTVEKVAALARPGSKKLASFGDKFRRVFTKTGLFNSDLFVIADQTLTRYSVDGLRTPIAGVVNGSGPCAICWQKGAGYERVFIADGLLLQYYEGGTHASAKLTLTGDPTARLVRIGTSYFKWGDDVEADTPDGSHDHPWIVLYDTTTDFSDADPKPTSPDDPLLGLINAIQYAGVPGTDYSSALAGPNTVVTAAGDDKTPIKTMTVTAKVETAAGNLIVSTVDPSSVVSAQGSLTSEAAPTTQTLRIGDTYFKFGPDVDDNDPDGTETHPWIIKAGTGDPLGLVVKALKASGVPGTDYSTDLVDVNAFVDAIALGGPPAVSAMIVAKTLGGEGNSIVTTTDGDKSVGTLTHVGTTGGGSGILQIGSMYYSYSANPNAGTPDGTSAHPWLVLATGVGDDYMPRLVKAINGSGEAGVDYSVGLEKNPDVEATGDGLTPLIKITLHAREKGIAGDAIVTAATGTIYLVGWVVCDQAHLEHGGTLMWGADTLTGGSSAEWDHATLEGGGVHSLHGVTMPDGVGAKAVTSLSGYVLVSVANSQRFYWLKPGEVTVDALDFASKESNPDNILEMLTIGDQVVIFGSGSTETWYPTGTSDSPFAPVQGRTYNRGIVDGTACVLQDSAILVGDDCVVYQVSGSGVNRISNHGVEEAVRRYLTNEGAANV